MTTRIASLASFAAVALASLAINGCAAGARTASVGFAVPVSTASAITAVPEVRATRVIATRVDLRQPIYVRHDGDAIEVTYATRQREGLTVSLDPSSLATSSEAPYVYTRCSSKSAAAHLARGVTNVELHDGREVAVFTTDDSSRVMARVGDDGPIPVSPEGAVVVGPPRPSTDGKTIAVVYVVAMADGFSLVVSLVGVSA